MKDGLLVSPGKKADLRRRPTKTRPLYASKEDYHEQLAAHAWEMDALQRLLYAHNRYALLLVFQGMDAAGKDGVIRTVMAGIDPQGCQVFSFKQPSSEDLDHDFLWRAARCLPERGRIGIFNRSYYEDVIIARVHPELPGVQGLPEELSSGKNLWKERYRSINHFEEHLHANGTRVLKFFLHLSKDEQRRRFLERIEEPDKNWKFSRADVEERTYWKDYRKAFETCLTETSTDIAPWHVIPADDKKNARLMVSRIIVDALKSLKMQHPGLTPERARELKALRKSL